jgi:MerR family transcriptional regulator, repressor of the yfmOP operon
VVTLLQVVAEQEEDATGMERARGGTAHMRQIGEVAETVNLSLRTIRYYGEVGLAPPSGRTAGGFRLYTDNDIDRLRLIKHMKPLEFSLDEMRELLDARDRLASPEVDDKERAALLERVAMFAAVAEARCDQLRYQLEAAEGMADALKREAFANRRSHR